MTPANLNVLVTGGSSGIGQATAREFARRGHTVFAAARRLSEPTTNLHPLRLDVTDPDSIKDGWASIVEATAGRGIDVLVNNAGFALPGPVEELVDADLRRQFDTNVFGLIAMTRLVLPGMRARGFGRIVNISSVLGRFTFPGMGAYSATKYAVESLSDALRQEVKPFGVDVIVIEPGFVATNLADAADARRLTAQPDETSPYAPLIARGEQYLREQLAEAIPADRLAVAIVDAALRRKPKTRHIVPAANKALVTLFVGLLPDRVADRAKHRALGLR